CVGFFFQAEDGIRDRNVTGVQTCALPISGEDFVAQAGQGQGFAGGGGGAVVEGDVVAGGDGFALVFLDGAGGGVQAAAQGEDLRSEERRGGTACGCGRVAEQEVEE